MQKKQKKTGEGAEFLLSVELTEQINWPDETFLGVSAALGRENRLIGHFLSSTGTEATAGKRRGGYGKEKKKGKKENRKREIDAGEEQVYVMVAINCRRGGAAAEAAEGGGAGGEAGSTRPDGQVGSASHLLSKLNSFRASKHFKGTDSKSLTDGILTSDWAMWYGEPRNSEGRDRNRDN